VRKHLLIGRLLHVLLFVGATALSLLRRVVASGSVSGSVWAEDGWIPLCVVANGHGACLDDQVNGYWPIFHRLVAEVFALMPLSVWPWLFPVIGAMLAGGVAVATFSVLARMADPFFAGLAALATVLIPFMGMEYLNVVGNIHWALLLIGMLTILNIKPNDEARVAHLAVLFVAGLSNPAGFVLVGYLLVLGMSGLLRRHAAVVLVGASLTGWLTQMVAIAFFAGTERVGTSFTFEEKLTAFANSTLGVVPGLRVFSNTPVSFLSVSTRLLPFVVAIGVFALVARLVSDRTKSEHVRRLAAFGLATQVLGAFLLLILDENPRYVYVVVALNTVWIVGILGVKWNPGLFGRALVVVSSAALWLPGFAAGPYRTTPSDVPWQEQLDDAHGKCLLGAESVTLHFAPERSYETEVPCDAITD
jgi:hypothetical protein